MRKLVWLLTVILILSLAISCAPPKPPVPAEEATSPARTEVVTIDIGWPMAENWDADPEVDGIEFNLTPKDVEDKMVETPGVVSAKLWLKPSFLEEKKKGDLVQEWSGIEMTKDDYSWLMGVTIWLQTRTWPP